MVQGRLMMFSLNMVDYPMYFLLLSTWDFFCQKCWGDYSKTFLLFEFYCGTPPLCLKVGGWWWWWVAYSILVSAKGPLVLGLELRGLGPELDKKMFDTPPLFHHGLVYTTTWDTCIWSFHHWICLSWMLAFWKRCNMEFDDVLLNYGGLPFVLPLIVHLNFFWLDK